MSKIFYDCEFLEGTQTKRFIGIPFGHTKPTIDMISIGMVTDDNRQYYAISKDFNLYEAWNRYQLEEDNSVGVRIGILPTKKKVYWIRENVLKPIHKELYLKYVIETSDNTQSHIYTRTKYAKFTMNSLQCLLYKYGKTNKQIAEEVKQFCYNQDNFDSYNGTYKSKIELYGYYSAYDHVALCWLFGKMIDLPKWFPRHTIDLKHILDEKVNSLNLMYGRDIWSNSNRSIKTIGKGECQEKDRLATFEEKLKVIKELAEYPKTTNEHNALSDAKFNKELYEFIKNL